MPAIMPVASLAQKLGIEAQGGCCDGECPDPSGLGARSDDVPMYRDSSRLRKAKHYRRGIPRHPFIIPFLARKGIEGMVERLPCPAHLP